MRAYTQPRTETIVNPMEKEKLCSLHGIDWAVNETVYELCRNCIAINHAIDGVNSLGDCVLYALCVFFHSVASHLAADVWYQLTKHTMNHRRHN